MKSPTYTPEFRAEAVKLVLAQGLTIEEAAQRIAMTKGTLANWVSAAKRGTAPKAPPGSRSVAELESAARAAHRGGWPGSGRLHSASGGSTGVTAVPFGWRDG